MSFSLGLVVQASCIANRQGMEGKEIGRPGDEAAGISSFQETLSYRKAVGSC